MKLSQKVTVKNTLGLHTRPATIIVKMLQKAKSNVTFTQGKQSINAKSILSILMLAAKKNTKLTITCEGLDAEKTLSELTGAFEMKFGEG